MKETAKEIRSVAEGSIAMEMEIEPGDLLLSINDTPVTDIFDYMFLTEDTYLEVLIRKPSGEEWLLEIDKEEDEELGIGFGSGLMDEYRSCRNRCIFCFIDQMPPGMRETLYFKDDDSRLSFLQGNYVTLTNMSEEDLDRIIRYHMSPINISFQAMNPELRCRMLHNRFAGDILKKVRKLADAGITMNGQIVLCRGVNDGAELEYSLEVLSGLYPALVSVSVVPVGLTKYREGLYPLEPFEKEDACAFLDQIGIWQEKMRSLHGVNFVYASDEWYLKAERPLPADEAYDGYPQLENGVGMLRLLETEVQAWLDDVPEGESLNSAGEDGAVNTAGVVDTAGGAVRSAGVVDTAGSAVRSAGVVDTAGAAAETERRNSPDLRQISIATGKLAGPFIRALADRVQKKVPALRTEVYEIRNDFFGETITVSGLITGQDLKKQLAGKDLGETLLIPVNMLRAGERVFLDDLTVEDLQEALGVPVQAVGASGEEFCRALLGEEFCRRLTGEAFCREQMDAGGAAFQKRMDAGGAAFQKRMDAGGAAFQKRMGADGAPSPKPRQIYEPENIC